MKFIPEGNRPPTSDSTSYRGYGSEIYPARVGGRSRLAGSVTSLLGGTDES